MKNFIITLVVIGSIFLTGCPKGDKTVRQLREKSAEMSVYGTKLVTAFGDAYVAGEITQSQLATLNVATGAFIKALGAYRMALTEAERLVNSGQQLPADALGKLELLLDDKVVAAFFDILASVGVLPIAQSEVVKTIISSIRIAILTIKSAFGDARQLLNMEVRHNDRLV